MGEVTANPNACTVSQDVSLLSEDLPWTRSMWQCSLSLIVETFGEVAQSYTSSNSSNLGTAVDRNLLKGL